MSKIEVGQLWVKLGLDKSNFDKGVNDAKGQSNSFGSFLKNAFQFTVGQGMFDLLKSGIKSAWDMSIGFNSVMQQNSIAFENMLGSADKSKQLLGELADMAANTPFELPQLTEASKKLLAFGFSVSQIKPMLTSVGDAAAGLGLGAEGVNRITLALGQMKAKAKVSGQEMMQLTEAGIPAWQMLGDAMGKSTAEVMKLSEQGLIPADQAIKQLVDGMESRFPGMMDKQSKSFKGLMSTLKDNVQMTLGDIMKPAFEDLTNNVLPNVVGKLDQVRRAFKLEGIKGVFQELIPPGARVALTALITGFVTYKAVVIASTIATQVHGIAVAISAVRTIGLSAATEAMSVNMAGATVAQWGLNAAMNANPVALVITLVGSLVGVLFGLKGILGSNAESTLKLKETMLSAFEEEKQKAIDSINARRQAELDALNTKRSALEQGHSDFIQKLNEQYGAYKSTQKSMTDIAKEEGEARKKALDIEYNSKIDALDNEIDAIDEKTKAEEKADKDAKNQEKINMLKNTIDTARHLKDKQDAQKELNELLKQMDREKLLAEREEQKKSLKKQQDTLREQLQKEKELVDVYIDNRIIAINKERKAKEDAEKLKYEAAKVSIDDEIKKINEKYDTESKREEELFKQKQKNIDELAKDKQANDNGRKTLISIIEMGGDWENGSLLDKSKILYNILSGNGYATGTSNASKGVHLVGENGPELVDFGGGETVKTASETNNILNKAKSVVQNLHINNLNIMNQGDQKRTLQQLQFMAEF